MKNLFIVLFASLLFFSCGSSTTENAGCCTKDCSKECVEVCKKNNHACSKDPKDTSCCVDENGKKKEVCCDGKMEATDGKKSCCSKEKAGH